MRGRDVQGRRAGRLVGVVVLAGALLAQGAATAGATPVAGATAGAVPAAGAVVAGAGSSSGALLAPGSPASRLVERLVRRLPAVRAVRVPLGDVATSQAYHVTDSGWVVGRAVTPPGPEGAAAERVFRWRHGRATSELLPHDGDILQVHDVGERGDVAVTRGWWRQGRMEAAVWRPDGSVEAITPPGVRSRAAAVNARGDVVGTFVVPGEGWHAFVWRGGQLQDLGSLGDEGEVLDVNDRGDVLARRTETSGAMLWRDGAWTELPGHAYDLDERGTRGPASGGTVVWEPNGRERDLGLPGLSAGVLAENGVVAGVLPPDDAVTWYTGGRGVLATRFGTARLHAYDDTLGDEATIVTGVNDLGVVVGYEGPEAGGGDPRAVAWVLGQPLQLADVRGDEAAVRWSQAFDVNARGLVVGTAEVGSGLGWEMTRGQAVVWDLLPTRRQVERWLGR